MAQKCFKCSVNSGRLPFIWRSLLCVGLGEVERNLRSALTHQTTECWCRQWERLFVRMWSPSGPLSAIGNKVKENTLVYSYAQFRNYRMVCKWDRGHVKSNVSRESQTALAFVNKGNELNGKLNESTETVDCRDTALLACCQCSLAHKTETLIKCHAHKAATKYFFCMERGR